MLRRCHRYRTAFFLALAAALIGRSRSAFAGEPYPRSPVIRELSIDWSTHRRDAPGSDNWPMTWAADGEQYAAWGDGGGFGGTNGVGRVSLGVARVEGDWPGYKGVNIWGGHNPVAKAEFGGKSYGLLSVGGTLHMWTSIDPLPHLAETRIASSNDGGRSWEFTDWSFKFVDKLTVPTFINFGKDASGARDEYVYVYAIHPQYGPGPAKTADAYNGNFDVHRPGRLYLLRVPKGRVRERGAYEFFRGRDPSGQPRWTTDINDKRPVLEDADGVGWNMSASYNAGLKRYLVCTEHSFSHRGCLSVFDAPEPWGPWTTVTYVHDFGAGHIPVNTFTWNFPTRWMSPDGTTAVMVFSGVKENDAFNTARVQFKVNAPGSSARKRDVD